MADLHDYSMSLLRGDVVRLRSLSEKDLPKLVSWWNDPAWKPYQSGVVAPSSDMSVAEQFRSWSKNNNSGDFGFSIEEIKTGQLLGHVTLWGIDPVVRIGNIGIIIGGEHVDQGFGTDAIRVLLRFSFEELRVNKVELCVWEFNLRAAHVYKRLGFKTEGVRREATFHNGRYWSQIQMGMLNSEYLMSR